MPRPRAHRDGVDVDSADNDTWPCDAQAHDHGDYEDNTHDHCDDDRRVWYSHFPLKFVRKGVVWQMNEMPRMEQNYVVETWQGRPLHGV